MKRSSIPRDPAAVKAWNDASRRRQRPTRRPVSPASPQQRNRTAGRPCIACGRSPTVPMHLADRSLGGCDDALCTVPGCASCHRAYDEGGLDLSPFLEPAHRAEAAHAVLHLGLLGAVRRITNTRTQEEAA